MGQTSQGRIKQFCSQNGLTKGDYDKNVSLGRKWCTGCKLWHALSFFNIDNSRYDGLTASCRDYNNASGRAKYKSVPRKKGRRFVPIRDGDKKQSRRRINFLVESGLIPHPNTLACTDCNHTWRKGDRRHEYDHHKGYSGENQEIVEPVCSKCHKKRTNQ